MKKERNHILKLLLSISFISYCVAIMTTSNMKPLWQCNSLSGYSNFHNYNLPEDDFLTFLITSMQLIMSVGI